MDNAQDRDYDNAPLICRLARQFGLVMAEVELHPNEKACQGFWLIWNTINGVSARLGLAYDETAVTLARPTELAINDLLDRIIAEGSERGGELTL